MSINEGDAVSSASDGRAQIKLNDGTFIAVRPNSEMRFDEHTFGQSGRQDRSVLSLVKGTLRTISGAIGKRDPDAVQIRTPVGTIGIRGTDHEPAYIPAGDTAFGGTQPGMYDKVNSGRTYLSTGGGTLELSPMQVGFAGNNSDSPVRMVSVPNFYQSASMPNRDDTTGSGDDNPGDTKDDTEPGDASPGDPDAGRNDAAVADVDTGDVNLPVVAEDDDGNTLEFNTQTQTDSNGDTTDLASIDLSQPKPRPVGALAWTGWWNSNVVVESIESDEHRHKVIRNTDGHIVELQAREMESRSFKATGFIDGSATTGQADHFSTNGIYYGAYQPVGWQEYHDNILERDFSLGNNLYMHWISGPGVGPYFISSTVSGTLAMNFDGGIAHGGSASGTQSLMNFDTGATSLQVNLSDYSMDIDIGLSGGSNWQFTATAVPLRWSEFRVDNFNSPSNVLGNLQITHNGMNTIGSLSGHLTRGLEGAVVGFAALGNSASEAVSGVAAFHNPSPPDGSINPARLIAFSAYDPRYLSNAEFDPLVSEGFYNRANEVTDSGNGLTGFTGAIPLYFNDGFVDRREHLPATITTGGTVKDFGSNAEIGISWGRWDNSNVINATRSGATLNTPLQLASLHYIAGPATTAPVTLPVSGTFDYSTIGATRPTDQYGTPGTLDHVALTANFSNKTVDVGVTASIHAMTFSGAASKVPIEAIHFQTDKKSSVPISVTCTGACGSILNGHISGAFVGAAAEGVGMIYSFGDGSTMLNGAAALKR